MSTTATLLRRIDKRTALALALPLALGAVAWPNLPGARAAAAPTFAQPQFADVIVERSAEAIANPALQPGRRLVGDSAQDSGQPVASARSHDVQVDQLGRPHLVEANAVEPGGGPAAELLRARSVE